MLLCLLLALLAGCSAIPTIAPAAVQTSPANPPPIAQNPPIQMQKTLPPPVVRSTTFTPVATAVPAPLVKYVFYLSIDYDAHKAQVSELISASSPSLSDLSELVLPVEAARTSDVFDLKSLAWEGNRPVEKYSFEDATLRIPLDTPLKPGEKFGLELRYTLNLKPMYSPLGYTQRQLNLGDWYPFIPGYKKDPGWLVHPNSPVGEHLVYPAADYTVKVTLAKSRYPLVLAASAPARPEKDGFSFELKGGRGFALSLSPEYQLLEGKNGVRAYVFPEHVKSGQASLQAAQEAMALFSDLYAPCPYPSLSIVEADFFDGMEYSGLFFLGADYFTAYPGNATSYLVPLSAHETAHEWWYGLVGDDPAMEPWLDEALATYSELLYYQKYHPDLLDWWWGYRVTRFIPQGKVDSTIYDLQAFRPYVDAVYLRGVLFLEDLRKQMGDDAFRSFLKDYTARNAYRIATRADFFAAVQAHTKKDLSDLIKEYFH